MKDVPTNVGKVSLRRLTATDLAFLHFKAALGFMLFVPIFQSQSLQSQTTAIFLWIWLGVTIAGLLVSVVGLVLGAQLDRVRLLGVRLELTGLCLLMAGPLVFMAVQLGLAMTGEKTSLLAVMFPYVVIATLLARMIMVATSAKVVYRIRGIDFNDD